MCSLCLALQKQVDAELSFNAAEMERLTGTHPLRYGDSIQVRHLSPLSVPALHPPIIVPLCSRITIFSPFLQLQHILTKKYVTVNETLTSRTENTSLRVELCDSSTSDSIFKILPRYKVCSVGDKVRDTCSLYSLHNSGWGSATLVDVYSAMTSLFTPLSSNCLAIEGATHLEGGFGMQLQYTKHSWIINYQSNGLHPSFCFPLLIVYVCHSESTPCILWLHGGLI